MINSLQEKPLSLHKMEHSPPTMQNPIIGLITGASGMAGLFVFADFGMKIVVFALSVWLLIIQIQKARKAK